MSKYIYDELHDRIFFKEEGELKELIDSDTAAERLNSLQGVIDEVIIWLRSYDNGLWPDDIESKIEEMTKDAKNEQR